MERRSVSSSNIHSIGYDVNSSTLEVQFLNGSIYQYFSVPHTLYLGLMSAVSHGEYLDAYIKKPGYRYARV